MNVTVYCGSQTGTDPRFGQAARELGTWLGSHGHCIVYGGSSVGLMGIVSRAVLDAGGTAIGVEPRFFIDAGVAQHDLTELIVVETMSERKEKMIELGDAFIALPGGTGTLEEISEIVSRKRLGLSHEPCILLNIDGFYEDLRHLLDKQVAYGFMTQQGCDLAVFAPTVEDAVHFIEQQL